MIFGKTKENYFWAGGLEHGNHLDAFGKFELSRKDFYWPAKQRCVRKSKLIARRLLSFARLRRSGSASLA